MTWQPPSRQGHRKNCLCGDLRAIVASGPVVWKASKTSYSKIYTTFLAKGKLKKIMLSFWSNHLTKIWRSKIFLMLSWKIYLFAITPQFHPALQKNVCFPWERIFCVRNVAEWQTNILKCCCFCLPIKVKLFGITRVAIFCLLQSVNEFCFSWLNLIGYGTVRLVLARRTRTRS